MPAIIAALLLVIGFHQPPPTERLAGTVTVGPQFVGTTAAACYGTMEVSDIRPGALVIVEDAMRNVVATTRLGAGRVTDDGACRFTFSVGGLPRSDTYWITVASWRFFDWSREDLAAQHWRVMFGIG
jgi:hypothetical protein